MKILRKSVLAAALLCAAHAALAQLTDKPLRVYLTEYGNNVPYIDMQANDVRTAARDAAVDAAKSLNDNVFAWAKANLRQYVRTIDVSDDKINKLIDAANGGTVENFAKHAADTLVEHYFTPVMEKGLQLAFMNKYGWDQKKARIYSSAVVSVNPGWKIWLVPYIEKSIASRFPDTDQYSYHKSSLVTVYPFEAIRGNFLSQRDYLATRLELREMTISGKKRRYYFSNGIRGNIPNPFDNNRIEGAVWEVSWLDEPKVSPTQVNLCIFHYLSGPDARICRIKTIL